MTRARLAIALAAVLVLSLVAGGVGGVAAADEDSECEPENSVTYDEFRDDPDTVDTFEGTGDAAIEKQNTNASVDADEAFVRLSVANANSYCVEYTIQMHNDVVTPATLGSISADDADVNADWRAIHDFDADETYTEVTMVVPGGTQATFAPSQLRVKSLSWTSNLESSGHLDRLTDAIGFGSSPLEERTHTIAGNESEQITVPLTHPDDAETAIGEWHATYSVDDETETKILSQGSGDAVFYRTIDDGEAIEIVFNEPAEVEFVAEPTLRDKARFQLDSFLSSLGEAFNLPVGFTAPTPGGTVLGGVF